MKGVLWWVGGSSQCLLLHQVSNNSFFIWVTTVSSTGKGEDVLSLTKGLNPSHPSDDIWGSVWASLTQGLLSAEELGVMEPALPHSSWECELSLMLHAQELSPLLLPLLPCSFHFPACANGAGIAIPPLPPIFFKFFFVFFCIPEQQNTFPDCFCIALHRYWKVWLQRFVPVPACRWMEDFPLGACWILPGSCQEL